MFQIDDFSDSRNKAWCIHCSKTLNGLSYSRDHAPTKSLLVEPHPEHLPQVLVCRECNSGFSRDEEYFVAFLSAVRSGTADTAGQTHPTASRILARNEPLRRRIERSRREYTTVGGDLRSVWTPESERIKRVVLTNARGHVMHELGEPMLDPPASVGFLLLESLSPSNRDDFESAAFHSSYPEVGSRMLTRMVTGQDLDGGWVIVQDSVYRYTVIQDRGVAVRSVIHDYLATEVVWDGA